jgi:3-hydroxyethyl bacteriochlorophyllide a dehydrogenase
MKSHAVVFTAPHQVSFHEIESPAPGPEDLVIELHHSWISNGTEGSFLRGERLSGDVAWRPGDPAPFPMVAGYQKVGRVLAVGSAAPGFAAGDWVFASMSRVCGMFDNQFAGHVSPSVCHHQSVQLLPAGADPLAFAGLVLTQVGYNCGSRAPIDAGPNRRGRRRWAGRAVGGPDPGAPGRARGDDRTARGAVGALSDRTGKPS